MVQKSGLKRKMENERLKSSSKNMEKIKENLKTDRKEPEIEFKNGKFCQ